MSKNPAKRSNFDKLPMELVNKISDINDPKHLPVEIVVNTLVKVTCRDRNITITHIFTAIHKDDVVKRIMPSGWVETYLKEFEAWMYDDYTVGKVKSKLYFDKNLEQPIEKYRVSLTRNVGANPMHLPTVDWQAIQRECKSIRSNVADRVIRFNRDHEIMGMECREDMFTQKKHDPNYTSRYYEVESLYHPKKKKKVKVSKELSVYNFKF